MSKHILIIGHVTQPRVGAMATMLENMGLAYKLCRTGDGEELPKKLSDISGLIILGGPMGVYDSDKLPWLEKEFGWIEKFLETGKPALGICLGCQILAHIHGGDVYAGERGMSVGFRTLSLAHKDEIFGHELDKAKAFCWHGDTYTVPEGATPLAKGKHYVEQAVRFADNVYGVQFHPEVDSSTIRRWGEIALSEGWRLPDKMDSIDEFLDQAAEHLPLNHKWLEGFLERLFKA